MCGIAGYITHQSNKKQTNKAVNTVLDCLQKMEYRGYDSAGIALMNQNGCVDVVRRSGQVSELTQAVNTKQTSAVAIGHTRWATHGAATENNAHPHRAGGMIIVHNGIVENYQRLKKRLPNRGLECVSDTDSEVIAWMLAGLRTQQPDTPLVDLVKKVTQQLEGTYGLVVMEEHDSDQLVATRRGSPLLIGKAAHATVIASDELALAGKVSKIYYLEDAELAVLSSAGTITLQSQNGSSQAKLTPFDMKVQKTLIGSNDHFLIKEILEQPERLTDTLRGRLKQGKAHLGGLNRSDTQLKQIKRIMIVGCGTSYYAGLLAKNMLEELLEIPVEVELASEYRYRSPARVDNTLGVVLSQSGETADTLAALKTMQSQNIHTLGLVNVVGSSIARAVDGGVYLHVGPEVSVASTKAFSGQYTAMLLLGLQIAQAKQINPDQCGQIANDLIQLPRQMQQALSSLQENTARLASSWAEEYDNVLFCGRNTLYSVALEAALKLKEVSYIHAEGYSGGELKHGPLALIDDRFLTISFIGDDRLADKAAANVSEVLARDGASYVISANKRIADQFEGLHVATQAGKWTEPLILNCVGQLIAYFAAKARDLPIDQPRNLAKSVTVE